MQANHAEVEAAARTFPGFSANTVKSGKSIPGLNKRALARDILAGAVPRVCRNRSIHRIAAVLTGRISGLIERVKDCQADGFIRVVDGSSQPVLSWMPDRRDGQIVQLRSPPRDRGTVRNICDCEKRRLPQIARVAPRSRLFLTSLAAMIQKWRETCETVVRQRTYSSPCQRRHGPFGYLPVLGHRDVTVVVEPVRQRSAGFAAGAGGRRINGRMWDAGARASGDQAGRQLDPMGLFRRADNKETQGGRSDPGGRPGDRQGLAGQTPASGL